MSELGKYSTSFINRENPPNIKRHVPFHYFDVSHTVISQSGEISQTTIYEDDSTLVGYASPVASGTDRYFFSFEILASHPVKKSEADPILGVAGKNLILTAQLPSGDFYVSQPKIQDIGLRKIDFNNWLKFEKGSQKKDILKVLNQKIGQPQAEQKTNLGKINFEFI